MNDISALLTWFNLIANNLLLTYSLYEIIKKIYIYKKLKELVV